MTAIIFDIGNVLFGYDPHHIISQLIPNSRYKKEYLDGLFNHQAWQDLDRGDISWEQAHSHLETHYNLPSSEKDTTYTLIHSFIHHLQPLDTIETLKTLKKNYPI